VEGIEALRSQGCIGRPFGITSRETAMEAAPEVVTLI
jgi:hypothetical protein